MKLKAVTEYQKQTGAYRRTREVEGSHRISKADRSVPEDA